MKLRKYIIGIIAMCVFVPVSANAASVSISCDKGTVEPNSTFNCTIKGNSSENITGISAKVELSSDLTLEDATVDKSVWMGDGNNGEFDLAAEAYPYPTGSFNIGKITVKAGSTTGSSTITIKSVDFINDSFDTNGVSSASTTIKVGEKTVETNSNAGSSSSNANNNIQTSKPSSSTTTNNNASTNTSKNNSTTSTQTTTKSANNYLKNIEIAESPIVFDKKTLEYTISIPYEVVKLNITAEAEDVKSTVVITGNENLIVGNNTATIIVTAENGKTKEYKIHVERNEENIVLSNDSSLAKLTIDGYTIDFKSSIYEYDLKIKKTESLKISTKTNDDNAKVTISGNKDLKSGSVIKVIVTAEDGTTSTYTINIEEQPSYTWMIISIIETIILIITYGVLITRKIISIKKQRTRI